MRRYTVILILMLSLTLAACQAPEPVRKASEQSVRAYCDEADLTCDRYEVVKFQRMVLNDADEVNGIESKWCVEIDYIHEDPAAPGKWIQSRADLFIRFVGGKDRTEPLNADYEGCLDYARLH